MVESRENTIEFNDYDYITFQGSLYIFHFL